jgi:hypothetical protein
VVARLEPILLTEQVVQTQFLTPLRQMAAAVAAETIKMQFLVVRAVDPVQPRQETKRVVLPLKETQAVLLVMATRAVIHPVQPIHILRLVVVVLVQRALLLLRMLLHRVRAVLAKHLRFQEHLLLTRVAVAAVIHPQPMLALAVQAVVAQAALLVRQTRVVGAVVLQKRTARLAVLALSSLAIPEMQCLLVAQLHRLVATLFTPLLRQAI